jgi:hypothetical protein
MSGNIRYRTLGVLMEMLACKDFHLQMSDWIFIFCSGHFCGTVDFNPLHARPVRRALEACPEPDSGRLGEVFSLHKFTISCSDSMQNISTIRNQTIYYIPCLTAVYSKWFDLYMNCAGLKLHCLSLVYRCE